MKPRKRKFKYNERYAVWFCNEKRCWICHEPLRFFEVTVDHVLPESLLYDDAKRQEILATYGLSMDFRINGYENWLPCHNHCNVSKGIKTPSFVPGNKDIIDKLSKNAHRAERRKCHQMPPKTT